MTELIFPLLNLLLFAYLVYRMRGSSDKQGAPVGNQDLPAWASQQLEELKARIEQLENALEASRKSEQEVLLSSATEKATLESAGSQDSGVATASRSASAPPRSREDAPEPRPTPPRE